MKVNLPMLVLIDNIGAIEMLARTGTEQIIELRTTLRCLGVPIQGTSYIFGDNKTVVDSSINPASKLNKEKRKNMSADEIKAQLSVAAMATVAKAQGQEMTTEDQEEMMKQARQQMEAGELFPPGAEDPQTL